MWPGFVNALRGWLKLPPRNVAGGGHDEQRGVDWIAPVELERLLTRHATPAVIDVRGAEEFMGPLGHVPSALNIPVDDIPARLDEIKALGQAPIVLVCRTDKRSANASAMLRDAGLAQVRVLRGGMEAWRRECRPMAPIEAGG